jgi:hypothetical protein
MLGLIKSDPNWRWAARGKHPSVKDFFSIGLEFQLAANFSEWSNGDIRHWLGEVVVRAVPGVSEHGGTEK